MDEQWEMFEPDVDYPLALGPREYFTRNCWAVVDCSEDIARYAIDYGLGERLLMSTDYPHHDSPFPNGMEMFLGHAGMTEAQKRAILWDNGARLFNLPVPSPPGGHRRRRRPLAAFLAPSQGRRDHLSHRRVAPRARVFGRWRRAATITRAIRRVAGRRQPRRPRVRSRFAYACCRFLSVRRASPILPRF